MTVREVIHALASNPTLDWEVIYKDWKGGDKGKEYPITACGFDIDRKKIILNNTYSY